MILRYTITDADEGKTAEAIMRQRLHISASLIKRVKHAAGITVFGEVVFSNYTLKKGEVLTVDVSASEPPCGNIPEDGAVEVLFENEGLLAVNKQSGVIIHPSHSRNAGTLSNFVAGYLSRKEGNGCCHAVNRLDRDTSGVVLFAKNSHMKARAASALSAADAKKEYVALVSGVLEPDTGVVDKPIKRLRERDVLRVCADDGQRAVTHYKTESVLEATGKNASLVRFRLETGRTHQIRVHMLSAGHPILGDKLYCTEDSKALSETLGITTQALHAAKLGFTEPMSGEYITLFANSPEYFCVFMRDNHRENRF